MFTDPTGMVPSTHIDEEGTIVAEYDDGDDGVYVHSNGTTQEDVDKQREENKNTGGTGEHIGEIGGEINVDEVYSNLLEKNIEAGVGPFKFKELVRNGGDWDLKNNKNTIFGLANHSEAKTTFTFNGQSMEAQDIGNHHFGATGKSVGVFSETFMLKQAGKAQIAAGTSKPEWQRFKTRTAVSPRTGAVSTITTNNLLPPYGDDPRDQNWIKAGFKHFKKNK